MARVEGGAVIIDTDWPGLKDQIDSRNINFKYEEDSTAYQIFAIDGQYFYQTIIYKSGQAPENQSTYDTWRTDFESNYKNRTTDFNSTQPVFLTTIDGYSVILKDGAAPTANDGYGVAIIGSDGSNYRLLKTDTSGRPVFVGAGTAGSPAGGIITIQGDPSGTPLPITGTITTAIESEGTNDAAIPNYSTLIGGTDGTNLRPLRVFDADTGGGQQWVLGVGLRKSAGGGSVDFGTSSDPIRIDPTGTTIQPVSGTVAANQGGIWTVQPGNTANTTPWLTTINQGGNSATVTASNALKVDGSAVTQPISGTITANAGTGNFTVVQSTASNLRTQTSSESNTGSAIPTQASMVGGSDGTNLRAIFLDSSGRQIVIGAAAAGAAVTGNPVLVGGSDGTNARAVRMATDGTVRIDPTGTTTQPVSGTVAATQSGIWNINDISGTITLPTGAATETTLTGVLTTAAFQARINTLGQKTMANSTPITIASDQTVIPVSDNGASLTIDTTQLPAALVGGRLDTNIGAWLGSTAPTVGSKTSANSIPVVVASDQGTITVNASATVGIVDNAAFTDGTTRIQPVGFIFDEVAGTALTENDGAAARIDSKRAQIQVIEDGATRGTRATVKAASTAAVVGDTALVVAVSPNNSVAVTQATASNLNAQVVGPGATGAALSGNPVRVAGSDGTNTRNITTDTSGRLLVSGAGASGAAATGNPVLVAGSDGTNARTVRTETDGTVRTKEQRSSTPSVTSVAASASNVTLLASNTNRLGATIYNDSNQSLYLKLGATASTTSFTVKLNKDDYYEIPFNYTGIIDGIWSSASGSARITEIT